MPLNTDRASAALARLRANAATGLQTTVDQLRHLEQEHARLTEQAAQLQATIQEIDGCQDVPNVAGVVGPHALPDERPDGLTDEEWHVIQARRITGTHAPVEEYRDPPARDWMESGGGALAHG